MIFSGCPIAQSASNGDDPVWPVSVVVAVYPAIIDVASCTGSIDPAYPPTPIPSSLPFHPATGSQTSSLMSESELGFASATTRQNAGRLLYKSASSLPLFGTGGPLNAPAATVCASLIVALGIFAAVRRSHASWAHAVAPDNSSMNAINHGEGLSFIVLSRTLQCETRSKSLE